MPLLIQNNDILMTNTAGEARFTTLRKMPSILRTISGTFTISSVSLGYNTTDYIILPAGTPGIQNYGYFILPSFRISNSDAQSGGLSLSGLGTVQLASYRQSDGSYAGSIIFDVFVLSDLSLVIRQTVGITTANILKDKDDIQVYSGGGTLTFPQPIDVSYTLYYCRWPMSGETPILPPPSAPPAGPPPPPVVPTPTPPPPPPQDTSGP